MDYKSDNHPQRGYKYQHLSGQRFNEVERLEKAWDATIDIAKEDLSIIENRRRMKSLLKWIEAFLYPFTKNNKEYLEAAQGIRFTSPHTLDEEINQMYALMKIEREAQTKTKLNPPKAVSYTIKWGEPSDCPVILDTQRILREQATTTIIFIGKPGIGKSFSARGLVQQIDPEFNIGRCFFETEDFFNTINTFKDTRGETIKPGNMLMWEEIGIAADNREFMSLKNKVISKALDVWRKKNLGLCLSMPSLDNLDSRIENRLDWIFEAKRCKKKPDGKLISTTFNVLVSQHNPIIQKTYKKHPVYTVDNEEIMINEITIYAPPEDVLHEYNTLSDKYKSKILKDLELELDNAKQKKEQKLFNMEEAVKEVLKHKGDDDYVTNQGTMRVQDIVNILHVPEYRAKQIQNRIGKVRVKKDA